MYAASSSVSAPPRPLRPRPAGSGPYLDPARPGTPVLGAGRARRAAGRGPPPRSGRRDLYRPPGAQRRPPLAAVHPHCPEFAPVH
ncbi:aminoglycoside phosphotransferase family protein, partial [Streptomyces sp. NPDC058964]